MCLSKNLFACMFSRKSMSRTLQSWRKTLTPQWSGLHSQQQEGWGLIPCQGFSVCQRVSSRSSGPFLQRHKFRTVQECEPGRLFVALYGLAQARPLARGSTHIHQDSPVTLTAGRAVIENGCLEINQAKLSLRSNQAALSHTLPLFRSRVWTLW